MREVTPLVLTFDEAPNIGRCLERLDWAERIVVLDSGSTDGTGEIVSQFDAAEWSVRPFDTHAEQWNHGLSLASTEWVLSLDADYVLTDDLIEEIRTLAPDDDVDAYVASFRYCVGGRPLRGSLYPPRPVLFRRSRCRYAQDGHTQVLEFAGRSQALAGKIHHDDRKPLSRWLREQDRYTRLEAAKLASADTGDLDTADRLRRWIVLAPLVTPLFVLFVRGALLDGRRGWYYAFQRTLAEILLSLRLLERRFAGETDGS